MVIYFHITQDDHKEDIGEKYCEDEVKAEGKIGHRENRLVASRSCIKAESQGRWVDTQVQPETA